MSFKNFCAGLLTGWLTLVSWQSHAAHVVVGDQEWRQLTETMLVTYGQVQSVCNPVCSGSLVNADSEAIDFTGWTWATFDNLWDLAASFNVPPPGANPTRVEEINSLWAPAFLAAFDFTSERIVGTTPRQIASGYRYVENSTGSFTGSLNDALTLTGTDVFSLGASNPSSTNSLAIDQGVWLYRSAVPLPAGAWLFVSALAGLVGLRSCRALP